METLVPLVDQAAQVFAALPDASPPLLGAFLAGAAGWAMGARLAVVGVGLLLAALMVPELQAQVWIEPALVAIAGLAVAQVLLTLALGEQSAGTVLVGLLAAAVVLLLWRGPLRAAALIPMFGKLWKGK